MKYIIFTAYYFILRFILNHRVKCIQTEKVPYGHYQKKYKLSDEDLKIDDPDYCKDYAADIIFNNEDYRIIFTRFSTFRLVFKHCARYPIKAEKIDDILEQMLHRDSFV